MEQTWNSSMNVRIMIWSFMYRTRQFVSPLTLKRTWIYPLIISNRRTEWTLTFVKTMAVFSTVCRVLLYTAIFAFLYQIPSIFPVLRGQCIKLKHGLFARLYPRHVRGLGAWLKPTGMRSGAFNRVRTLNSPPIWSQGFGPFAENGFRAFFVAKMSCEDTQHK